MRVTSAFWVSAYIRRCHGADAFAVVRRRGAAEAGAIFVVVDSLDGTRVLYAPAPQSLVADESAGERTFLAAPADPRDPSALEERLAREIRFDSDLWIIEVEDREGRHFLNLADPDAERF